MVDYLQACETLDEVWKQLHERVGLCGHCAKRSCPGRRKHSELPVKLSTDALKKAMNAALKAIRLGKEATDAPGPNHAGRTGGGESHG